MGLWHGTGTNKPEVIATTGFDIAYSEDLGYWGRGIYFAQDATYSAPAYCYKPEGTTKTYEIFLADVVLGKFDEKNDKPVNPGRDPKVAV